MIKDEHKKKRNYKTQLWNMNGVQLEVQCYKKYNITLQFNGNDCIDLSEITIHFTKMV